MNFLSKLFSNFVSGGVGIDVTAVETEARQVATAVAVWGIIVAFELAVIIYFEARSK